MTGLRVLATSLCLLATGAAFAEAPLPRARPEEVGLSSERLARIGETLKADIETGRIPGAVIAIARHGRLVVFDAYGWGDQAARHPHHPQHHLKHPLENKADDDCRRVDAL